MRPSLLVQALRDPASARPWSLRQWDECIRQAHRATLTARLAEALASASVLDAIPHAPRQHLLAARIVVEKHRRDVAFEIRQIENALRPLDVPVLLLKGAAYVAADLPLSHSRLFHDVDFMVPHAALGEVERLLRQAGWISATPDSYDQSYYRRWSHELPPLVHGLRGTSVDVHHTILPPTATPTPDPERLMASARRVRGRLRVLDPVDLFLHSATHLFHEGEFDSGLRDLTDLHDLLVLYEAEEAFAPRLARRARAFGLERIVHHALHMVTRVYGAAHVPELDIDARMGPTGQAFMDALFDRALAPAHSSADDAFSQAARFALYVRGHWLRMPPRLLLPHLARKALRRLRGERTAAAAP